MCTTNPTVNLAPNFGTLTTSNQMVQEIALAPEFTEFHSIDDKSRTNQGVRVSYQHLNITVSSMAASFIMVSILLSRYWLDTSIFSLVGREIRRV